MGWLKLSGHTSTESKLAPHFESIKPSSEHIESTSVQEEQLPFSHYPKSTPDIDLRFISPMEVSNHTSRASGGIWIVVDNVVYDCTSFINDHPGGEEVIRNFGGQECSWQFWRFHGKKEMEEFGKDLRVGRTEGLKNRFKEPVRWVGLRTQGLDEW